MLINDLIEIKAKVNLIYYQMAQLVKEIISRRLFFCHIKILYHCIGRPRIQTGKTGKQSIYCQESQIY